MRDLGRLAWCQGQRRNLMHIPVSEVLGRQVIAGDLSCLAVIQAPGGQWNNEEAIPNLGALNDPWYLDVANDGESSTSGVIKSTAPAVDESANTRRISSSVGTESRL
jgi:hypothetical protein